MTKTPRFILTLPSDITQQIEAYRVANELKSSAEAVRRLVTLGLTIKHAPVSPTSEAAFAPTQCGPAEMKRQRDIVLGEPGKSVGVTATGYQVASLAEVEAARRSRSFLKPTKGKK